MISKVLALTLSLPILTFSLSANAEDYQTQFSGVLKIGKQYSHIFYYRNLLITLFGHQPSVLLSLSPEAGELGDGDISQNLDLTSQSSGSA